MEKKSKKTGITVIEAVGARNCRNSICVEVREKENIVFMLDRQPTAVFEALSVMTYSSCNTVGQALLTTIFYE